MPDLTPPRPTRAEPSLLQLEGLEDRIDELSAAYASAAPYPHAALDGLLAPDVLERLVAEHHAVPDDTWTNYLHLNERKYANKRPDTWGPTLQAVADELAGPAFVAFLERLTGIDGLLADPALDGGGLHRSLRGGFLNVHADFTAHHDDPTLHRRVNLLLYLNPGWEEAWGGALELWSPGMERCVTAIPPLGGRVVVFTTTETSFHGHPEPLACPADVARRSLALYYFTADRDVRVRATTYRARPDDGGLRGLGIFLDTRALRVYDRVKRRLHLDDRLVSRISGLAGRSRGRRSSAGSTPPEGDAAP